MRIAIVTENFLPKLDGVTRTLAMTLEHLHRHGHRALVMGPTHAVRRYEGALVLRAPGIPLPFYPEIRLLFPPRRFKRALERFRPDVVHVVDPMAMGAVGVSWARKLGVPVLATYHTNLAAYCAHYGFAKLENPTWAYRRRLHNQCALTLCPSPSTASQLIRRGFERVGVWPRGVDSVLFRPDRRSSDWRRGVTGTEGGHIVLYVGRLSHEKNLSMLVDAFRVLGRRDTHFVLVGDGPARPDLQRQLTGQRVTFTGYLRGEELATAYASADVFAFPSETETFGQVVFEAMASGLPVVARAAEGVCDLVTHGETGYLAPTNDPAQFAAAIELALDEDKRRRAMGARGRAIAERNSWERVLVRLVEMYRDLSCGDVATVPAPRAQVEVCG